MGSILYIDAFSGAAGDMLLSALVDLGIDHTWLTMQLHHLPIGDFTMTFNRIADRGLSGLHLDLAIPTQNAYRHLPQILEIINQSGFSDWVTSNARQAFSLLAEAEALVHGCSPDKVHFHEVGAIDTIVDICGYFLCLEKLGQPQVVCSPLPMPTGSIDISHGKYPLPAPAITYLLKGFHVYGSPSQQEMVTPTAAVLLASSAQSSDHWPQMRITGTGYGCGTPGRGPMPNLLRIIQGEVNSANEQVIVIEAQMDDITPEILASAGDLVLSKGALDYYITPVNMKKSRPGHLLTILCTPDYRQQMIDLVLSHTTTLGVRHYSCDRQVLPRQIEAVSTPFGLINVKVAYPPLAMPRVAPEYEDCARAAQEHGIPIHQVYSAAQLAWQQKRA